MTEKQYKRLEKLVEAAVGTIIVGATILFLLGVYAVATQVF